MKKLPHELVEDSNYFRDVMRNMKEVTGQRHTATVRFGITGDGISPHYEITAGEGLDKPLVFSFDGKSHKRFHSLMPFDEARLTESYTYLQVIELLDVAYTAEKAKKGRA